MIFVHIKNLEKYHPGYKDRQLIWAKLYFQSFLDFEVQKLNEIDRYRFWSLIVFEIYLNGKELALSDTNLKIMGWDTKKRSISLSLQMLQPFIEVRNAENESPLRPVTQIRIEESRVEESRGRAAPFTQPSLSEVTEYAKSLNFPLDCQKFIDHYKAVGWKVGKTKMVDWQAAVRTWRKEDAPPPAAPGKKVLCDCGCGQEITTPAQLTNTGKFFNNDCRKKALGW